MSHGPETGAAETRATIQRFCLMSAATALFSRLAEAEIRLGVLYAMLMVTALAAAVFALAKRERFAGPTLNRWDEALAHLALALLVGLFLGDASARAGR